MTEAEILQSKFDWWHLRNAIEARVRRNAPSRTRRKRV